VVLYQDNILRDRSLLAFLRRAPNPYVLLKRGGHPVFGMAISGFQLGLAFGRSPDGPLSFPAHSLQSSAGTVFAPSLPPGDRLVCSLSIFLTYLALVCGLVWGKKSHVLLLIECFFALFTLSSPHPNRSPLRCTPFRAGASLYSAQKGIYFRRYFEIWPGGCFDGNPRVCF